MVEVYIAIAYHPLFWSYLDCNTDSTGPGIAIP
jgi:hypothetical protein